MSAHDTAARELVTTASDLVATLPGIVWEADGTDYRMTYVSPRAAELLGHDPEAWLAQRTFWEDHLHPADRARTVAEAQAAIDSLSSATLEYRFADSTGAFRSYRDYIRVIEQPDGHRHVVGFMVDVTDEAAVDDERRLLAAAVENAAEAVVITDEAARILYVNPAFERVTGYPREEVIGRNPRLLQSGRHAASFYEQVWGELVAGRSWSGELVNRRRDGRLYTELASITPVRDRDGRRRYVAVQRDVTEERAHRAAREWLAASVESAADAVYTISLDGVYLAWNDAAARIYGWSRHDVVGRSIFDVVPAEEHANIRSWLARVGAGESLGPVDTTHLGAGGRELALSVIASPVRNAEGEVTGVATIARDISQERAQAAQQRELEARVRQGQKMEAIGRLAGGIAHDFNNALTAISGYATLLAQELDGPQRADADQVVRAAERATDLTRRLLAFARSAPLDPRSVDVDEVLEDAATLVRRLVPERISFEVRLAAGCHVVADPIELEQLLLNLVGNAVDATPGAGRIAVTTARSSDGSRVVLTVTDTGAGMDEPTLSHIFEPFFTTKPDGHGTGLGLATVYSIVQRAAGTIAVRSTPGSGTTFTITLPVATVPATVARPVAPDVPGGNEHVLVVEDAEVLRDLAARLLREAGYRVSVAGSPDEVAGRDLGDVDGLVCDVVMPGMSGPEMVRRLGLRVPVVFVSGHPIDELRDLAEHRHWAYLEKPYSRQVLLATLRRLLDARVESAV